MTGPRLNEVMVLEEHLPVPDGAGGDAPQWVAVCTLHVALRARAAAETETGESRYGVTAYRATLRYAPHGALERPRPDQRLRTGDRIFNILGVAEADDRKQWLTCWLEEGGAA